MTTEQIGSVGISEENGQGDLALRAEEILNVDLGAFEGPIDLLLRLAREQKVDLANISILALADQYLAYINAARRLRLEVAADYLVMAAWLAYLKSRLLIPTPPEAQPSADEMAAALAFQLLRLEAMQNAAVRLFALPQENFDFFGPGEATRAANDDTPEEKAEARAAQPWSVSLYELLRAVGEPLKRQKPAAMTLAASTLFSTEEALARLRNMLGHLPDWTELVSFLPVAMPYAQPMTRVQRRSALASTFVASLELAKLGQVELRQDRMFAPIFVRRMMDVLPEVPLDDGSHN